MKKNVLISAGEVSGDIHAANLIKEIQKKNSDVDFFGMGCENMQNLGVDLIERMDQHSIIGLWEIVENLSFIKKLFDKFEERIKKGNIDLAILVDYPGFNIRLAKMCNKYNIPCVYYITPQVWAWGQWRVKTIKKLFKKCIVIFDFEKEFFNKHGVASDFVGHPLLDEVEAIDKTINPKEAVGINKDKYTISLLPGSRTSEIRNLLPKMLQTARILKEKMDVQFIISKSANLPIEKYEKVLENFKDLNASLIEGDVYNVINASDFVIACSGTVTLQVAIARKPMIITYITAWFTFVIGLLLVRPPIGLVNIISKKYIVDEMLQFLCNPSLIASRIMQVINSEEKTKKMVEDLTKVRDKLGAPGASKNAASIICDILK